MDQPILKQFGGPISRVEKALKSLRKGNGVLVTDNADRENEGDLIFSAETLTNEQMAMLIRECSGIVCLCMTEDKINSLGLPMMVENNTSAYNTAFTISIEAAEGVTTGVSAADRVTTVKAAVASDATPACLASPGHVFPLCAKSGGVLERGGHTEATVDLNRLAGLAPCGVLAELTNPDGTMAKLHEIVAFAIKHQMAMCTVQDIIAYREHIGDIDATMVAPENGSAVAKPSAIFPRGTFASGRSDRP
ncbi:3,4-dihydroxy-2-butanone-4-phosphate synthase [uncultured Pseudodesulfovibrio sp.]|uniref:3,4-dihydroxy-2-butanone-4-phosphate synthase n=1 Tax=uncultured Pseudodesulfovibrio sp. TaxID=2035858 RepID=UPI0029C94E8B|nr:3,4-dihydroxy-2-butanone-4-phosphate synthase [uncultured Pseudodesulfovibrio sp.]